MTVISRVFSKSRHFYKKDRNLSFGKSGENATLIVVVRTFGHIRVHNKNR